MPQLPRCYAAESTACEVELSSSINWIRGDVDLSPSLRKTFDLTYFSRLLADSLHGHVAHQSCRKTHMSGRQEVVMKIRSIIVGAAAFALGSTAATADTVIAKSNPLPAERVSFADLNLYSAAGKAILDRRIRGAAKRVCIVDADRSLENFARGRMCYSAAVADGHQQMNEVIASGQFGTSIATATLTIRGQ